MTRKNLESPTPFRSYRVGHRASRGIGAAVALELAHAGTLWWPSPAQLADWKNSTTKSKQPAATLVPLDVKDSEGIARLALRSTNGQRLTC